MTYRLLKASKELLVRTLDRSRLKDSVLPGRIRRPAFFPWSWQLTTSATGTIVVCGWLASCGYARGQEGDLPQGEPGLSPGPAGRFSGMDHRVPLTWLTQPGSYGPGNYGRRIYFGDRKRYYEIHVPPTYKPNVPAPVVMVLHGGGGYATLMRYISGMDTVSDKEGFLVVYPAGTSPAHTDRRLFWNVGHPMKDRRQAQVDDVGYFSAVLDDLPKYFSVDSRRVYATGISNGSMMSYRLAAELSDRIAAIGPVAGQRGVDEFAKPPARAVPIIHFHGKQDSWALYDGGPSWGGRQTEGSVFEPYRVQPVEKAIQTWIKHDGIAPTPEVTRVGQAHSYRFSGGRDGAEVVLWVFANGGHTWPGGKATRFEIRKGVGNINRDISASKTMWEFFKRHALAETPARPD
jgi:polyhydroxybutyrate depolymerase